jgi:hypothetical protein
MPQNGVMEPFWIHRLSHPAPIRLIAAKLEFGLRGRDFSPSRRTAQAATPVANAVLSGIGPNIMSVVGGKGGLNKAVFLEGAH